MRRYFVLSALALCLCADSAQAGGWGFNFNFRGTFSLPQTTGRGYAPPVMWPGYGGGPASGDPFASDPAWQYPGQFVGGMPRPINQIPHPYGGYGQPGPMYAGYAQSAGGFAGYTYSMNMNGSFGRYGYPYDSYDAAFPSPGPAYPLGQDAFNLVPVVPHPTPLRP